ncbi:hypothetical protein QO034_07650 [Sedimentitalea sp. JM2-8]|uniref:Uncharacterized protein n=1 Tax=Sedimentitalea xiamensis TaxID=3050037 RepID=A0ABT7FCY4_9RHOB|nr:hypothetical protein [Sedimentitalea xiamensis]MDK3072979.1 hypothetical protein [Sedimentitalea xiamensis]
MFLELIGTIFAGVALAGMVMLVNRLTGGRLPRWSAPVAAGFGMLSMTVFMEYSWFDRTTATLPEGVFVAQSIEKARFYQPWTYVVPYVDRFVAVDSLSVRRHADLPDQRMADLYFFGRWAPLKRVPVLFDCAEGRMATLIDGATFDDSGQVIDPDWVHVDDRDAVLASACGVS